MFLRNYKRRKHYPAHFMRLILLPYQNQTRTTTREENYKAIFLRNTNAKILQKILAIMIY